MRGSEGLPSANPESGHGMAAASSALTAANVRMISAEDPPAEDSCYISSHGQEATAKGTSLTQIVARAPQTRREWTLSLGSKLQTCACPTPPALQRRSQHPIYVAQSLLHPGLL
mmetsp:Transcript_51702/g.93160  ORF Transcript_51702/g.93160 Transcript_51702/m.93160 type:complete len:114 (+) Transcript_51702:175-516(+)